MNMWNISHMHIKMSSAYKKKSIYDHNGTNSWQIHKYTNDGSKHQYYML